ncbi:hypothetical protein BCV72DRAFT_311170 [Rhizopus microsporus var. microsporus]|uniref:Uncharacterized protein n=1 Tax=Rhizopus microsporus var. microsporus TaxID=86635 RepID=A0A1X0RFI3_RHIZD|nr:hypothetical protein BCV72DRAFT_311170 [Rhizopus microsporus var. microsporus]
MWGSKYILIHNDKQDYTQKHATLKIANHRLCALVLKMDPIKTSGVNAIRRLMEKLPLVIVAIKLLLIIDFL